MKREQERVCVPEEASPCVSTPVEIGAVEALDNCLLKRSRKTECVLSEGMWNRSGISVRKLTPILPHVWKAVNKNIKLMPNMTMFKSFLPSGFIFAGGFCLFYLWRMNLRNYSRKQRIWKQKQKECERHPNRSDTAACRKKHSSSSWQNLPVRLKCAPYKMKHFSIDFFA